ncbi:MAG: MFS transporter, partial [Gammaproteobacteria bacterium]
MTPAGRATPTDWRTITYVFFAGVAAAIILAKGSAAAPAVRQEMALELAQIGWLMSISNLATLLFGTVAGQFGIRFGLPTMVKTGLAIMTLAALGSLFASNFPTLLAGRTLEGIGIVLFTVAAPSWIASLAEEKDRAMAMGVWALWMPVGSVIIMLLSPLLIAAGGWRALWLVSALCTAGAWLLIVKARQTGQQQPGGQFDLSALRRLAPWLLAATFACFSFQFFSVFTFLPLYFTSELKVADATAAGLVSIIPFMIIPGNLLGGLLAKKGIAPWQLILFPAVIMLLLTQLLFSLTTTGSTAYVILACYGFFLGIIPTAIFIQAPRLATSAAAAAPINGLGMSGQGLGILL